MTYSFDANVAKETLITGIREWFDKNGKDCNAILGLSGGKDSTIVCALLCEAIGPERVYTFGLPDVNQGINDADKIAKYFGAYYETISIENIVNSVKHMAKCNANDGVLSKQTEQNIPSRARMIMLYALSQSLNGRVIGTCNLSENYIGYLTKYGDGASDFEPIAEFTVHELLQIGDALGIPHEWTYKTPDDGLPHSMPDDEKLMKESNFNYELLDKYLRFGTSGNKLADEGIKRRHNNPANIAKLKMQDTIKYEFFK